MLKHYLFVAARNLISQKLYSIINIAGLAIGLACCILIALFIRNELSYDTHWENSDRVYRITREFKARGGTPALYLATMAPNTAPLMKEDFPEIEAVARMLTSNILITREDASFYESGIMMSDPEVTEIFDFDWVRGNPATALSEPFTMVLTESLARKYFGDGDPMGESVTVENAFPAKITGIIRDLPANTHMDVKALSSILTLEQVYGNSILDNWGNNSYYTYALLPAGYDIGTLADRFPDFTTRHIAEDASEWTAFHTQALKSIHLHSRLDNEQKANGSITTVYTFGAIAAFVLLIACINFMNLSTARSTQRAKEVGMRKVMGATRGQIITQFLGESIVFATIAVILAIALVELALPSFSAFLNKALVFDYVGDVPLLASLLGLTVLVGLIAGSYPAFYLSAFRPAQVLKGDLTRGKSGAALRKSLVVLQFAICIALVIATGTVFSQMRYAQTMELGYDRERVLTLSGSATAGFGENYESLKQSIERHPGIISVTASDLIPTQQHTNSKWVRAEHNDPVGRGMPDLKVDYGFFETYGIDILAGRSFSEDFGTDKFALPSDDDPKTEGAFMLNELAARQLGWSPEEAVGKWFEVAGASEFRQSTRGPIIGVVRDFHFSSIREKIKPMYYYIPPPVSNGFSSFRFVSIRFSGNDLESTLAHIEEAWKTHVPGQPFSRSFTDSRFEALYQSERRQGQVFTYFALLAIFIACLGLLGLASFTTERRTKEIGIRKVLGGSVKDIVLLVSKEFTVLVLVANIIAWPAAYLLMTRWLENFAYRISLGPAMFIAAAAIALAVAWVTVGLLAARAANAKPVMALRYE